MRYEGELHDLETIGIQTQCRMDTGSTEKWTASACRALGISDIRGTSRKMPMRTDIKDGIVVCRLRTAPGT
jgi:hypothetical protein